MSYKYEFSICAIFNNESMVITQWLDHHLQFGCEHFYLIDNNSRDEWRPVLSPFLDRGLVSLASEPRPYRQWYAYNEYFLSSICQETRWVGILDIDEYLYPRAGQGDIREVLALSEDIDALAVPWLLFGSSGHVRQPASIVHSFLLRRDYDRGRKTSFKTLVRTSALARTESYRQESWRDFTLGIHSHRLKPGAVFVPAFFPRDVDLRGEPTVYCCDYTEAHVASTQLAINHYMTMSLDYFRNVKAARKSAATPRYDSVKRQMKHFEAHDLNEKLDETLSTLTRSRAPVV